MQIVSCKGIGFSHADPVLDKGTRRKGATVDALYILEKLRPLGAWAQVRSNGMAEADALTRTSDIPVWPL